MAPLCRTGSVVHGIGYPECEMNGATPEHEFITEALDETQQLIVLDCVVKFLRSKAVAQVGAEFGFVLDRELRGQAQGQDALVPVEELHGFLERGLLEGTIEWCGSSDFLLSPVGLDLKFKLCNDRDLHFSSRNMPLLIELSNALAA